VGSGFAGRTYDHALLAALPPGVDPCGEYGEFHTFVYDGPIFANPVAMRVGEIVVRDGRYYADLLPEALACTLSDAAALMPPV
jgi:diphthamide synthase (EF-2-diphthine--ammonia ligase)